MGFVRFVRAVLYRVRGPRPLMASVRLLKEHEFMSYPYSVVSVFVSGFLAARKNSPRSRPPSSASLGAPRRYA